MAVFCSRVTVCLTLSYSRVFSPQTYKLESHWDLDKQTADNLVWAEGEKQQ